jgi:chromosome segregation ATPase
MIAIAEKYWRLLVLVALLAALWGFSHWRYVAGQDAANTAWKQAWAKRDAADAKAVAQREAAEREEERRRQAAVDKESNDAEQKIAAAAADAKRADLAAAGLRDEISRVQRQLRNSEQRRNATVAELRQAREAVTELYAQLLRESDKAAGEYAAEADRSFTAGQACERIYDAVRERK